MDSLKGPSKRNFLKQASVLSATAISALSILNAFPFTANAKSGENYTFLFQGDSITDGNRSRDINWNYVLGHGYAYVLIGTFCRITFQPIGKYSGELTKAWQYLKVEEGRYDNGILKSRHILNGDETDWGGPRFGAAPTVLQTALIFRF